MSLQRAIAVMPPTAAIYVDLAITFLRAGELDKAIGQLWPAEPPAAGTAHARLGRRHRRPPHGACGGPERADAYNVLGLLLGRKGAKSDDVAAAFERPSGWAGFRGSPQ